MGRKVDRWPLARRAAHHAPHHRRHLAFTPDCSREEADQMVLGLNEAAKEIHKADAKMTFPAVGRAICLTVALSLGLGAGLLRAITVPISHRQSRLV